MPGSFLSIYNAERPPAPIVRPEKTDRPGWFRVVMEFDAPWLGRQISHRAERESQWLSERMATATELHRRSVQIDPDVRGGVPVVFGTRIPVARVFAELANDHSLSDVADNLGIDESLPGTY